MKPNILFIVADDLNAWIGALGRNPDVKTPNIDALAARGTLFTNAYCAAPYCNASRMSVFTGCLPTTTGIYQNEPLWDVPGRRTTLIELMRTAGYYTFGAGKVFHGVFDYAGAGRARAAHAEWREIENRPYLWEDFRTNGPEPLPDGRPLNKLFDHSDFEAVSPMYHHFDWGPLPDDRIDRMPDARVANAVAEFLHAPVREPFFCAAGLYKPHLPWHVPGRFFDLYDVSSISLPLVKSDDLNDVPPIARDWALSPPDHELVTTRGQWRPAVHAYLAAISYCDHVVGQIVAALDASSAADRTIIVLWGDNGFHLGEKLHWRKFVLWEEATRVPLIIASGQTMGQHRVYSPVSLIDIFPTLLELCGIEASKPNRWREPLSSTSRQRHTSKQARDHDVGKRKSFGQNAGLPIYPLRRWTEELYDHRADPSEWTNLATISTFDGVRDQIRTWLPD